MWTRNGLGPICRALSWWSQNDDAALKSLSRSATLSPACHPKPNRYRSLSATTGALKTPCTGCWMWPSRKTTAASAAGSHNTVILRRSAPKRPQGGLGSELPEAVGELFQVLKCNRPTSDGLFMESCVIFVLLLQYHCTNCTMYDIMRSVTYPVLFKVRITPST